MTFFMLEGREAKENLQVFAFADTPVPCFFFSVSSSSFSSFPSLSFSSLFAKSRYSTSDVSMRFVLRVAVECLSKNVCVYVCVCVYVFFFFFFYFNIIMHLIKKKWVKD